MIRSERLTSRVRTSAIALAAMSAVLLSACGQKKDAEVVDPSAGEVVARVNGDEISSAQLNIALQKQRAMRPDVGDAASKQVLDQLIDEQIVAQKAVAAKLDKDPKVLQQLESARRDILARRFIEQAAETVAKPPEDQLKKFYDSRPAMFAQRKVYTLQRLDIQVPDERRAEVDAHVRSLKTSTELTDWLKAQNLHFNTRQEQQASEQLAPAILDKLATLKEGESTVLPSQFGVSALTLVSAAVAPKTFSEARGAIEQFLTAQGRREVVIGLQKTLREGAKIDYEGRFAAAAAASAASAATPGLPIATAASNPAAPAASSAAASAAQTSPAQK